MWSYTSTPPIRFLGMYMENLISLFSGMSMKLRHDLAPGYNSGGFRRSDVIRKNLVAGSVAITIGGVESLRGGG